MADEDSDDLTSERAGERESRREGRREGEREGEREGQRGRRRVLKGDQVSGQGSSDQGSEVKCFAAGIRLLAGREYSVKELSTKLARRFSPDAVARVVSEMHAQGYVCDTRYGEAFCRSRVARGYGPVFIARELEQNGLDSDLIDALLQPYEDCWLEHAVAQVAKKTSKGRSRGALFDHGYGSDNEVDDTGEPEIDEAFSSDQRREAWQRDQKERGRLARFLARRGFSGTTASRAIKIGLSGHKPGDD